MSKFENTERMIAETLWACVSDVSFNERPLDERIKISCQLVHYAEIARLKDENEKLRNELMRVNEMYIRYQLQHPVQHD